MIFNADGSIQCRIDTESNWETANPILKNGELAIVNTTDGTKMKAGDGVHRYTELGWCGGGGSSTVEWGSITGDISDQTDLMGELDGKADSGVSYTKAETNILLSNTADKSFSNVNQTAKNNSLSWLMPNFSAGVSGYNGYVAPKDGWIASNMYMASSDNRVYVDGVAVGGDSLQWSGDWSGWRIYDFFPIRSGSKVTFRNGDNNAVVFYPCRGA